MTDTDQDKTPSRRGEAAWKAEKERIADRNAQTRKAGREQRQAYERGQSEARRARETRQMAELLERDSKRF